MTTMIVTAMGMRTKRKKMKKMQEKRTLQRLVLSAGRH